MELELDPALLRSMKNLRLADPGSVVREAVALFLFQKKLVSAGKAASLADMSLAGFMDLLDSVKVPQAEYTPEDLSMDLKTLRSLKRKRGKK
ncbi:MAG: UPF0175 family protein [Deferribacteres bacterium]|nr:UPF0175 family protein [Deferribacteres bacterium]